MEQNTDKGSETPTDQLSTNGFRLAALKKTQKPWETNVFKRFLRGPQLIAFLAFFVIWIGLTNYIVRLLPNTFWGGVSGVAACGLIAIFANWLKLHARTAMTRRRMWFWVRSKFSTWPEFAAWLLKTDSARIDYLAGIPNESWTPLPEGDAVTHDGY